MGNYKVKVNIEIVECEEAVDAGPKQVEDGTFEFTITADEAASIDASERALLSTNYPALRAALAHHLESLSKKSLKPNSKGISGR